MNFTTSLRRRKKRRCNTSPFKVINLENNSQGLSKKALIAKRKRDLAAAKTPDRRAKKAENQRIGQRSDSDIHHVNGKVGNTRRVPVKSNRGGGGKGTKNEKQNK